MTGTRVAASRLSRAVRTTIPGRTPGGWNFDSRSSKASPGAVPRSPPHSTGNALVTSGFTLPNVLPDQSGSNAAWPAQQSQSGWPHAGHGSGAEQLRLGGGEFLVGQHALLVQRGQLVRLVEHGRRLRGGRWRGRGLLGRRRRRLIGLLLFQVADALVLLRLHLCLLRLAPGPALAHHVRAAAHRGRAQ